MARDLILRFDGHAHFSRKEYGSVSTPMLANSHLYLTRQRALFDLIDKLKQIEVEAPIYVMKETGLKLTDRCANGSPLCMVAASLLGNLRFTASVEMDEWNLAALTFCSQLQWDCPVYLDWH